MFETLRDRLRKGAFSVGVGGAAIGVGHDPTIGAVMLAGAAVAIAVDAQLTNSSRLPWGGW